MQALGSPDFDGEGIDLMICDACVHARIMCVGVQRNLALNEHLCPIRRHKRLKYMQAARSSSQRIKRSKSWYHMHERQRNVTHIKPERLI